MLGSTFSEPSNTVRGLEEKREKGAAMHEGLTTMSSQGAAMHEGTHHAEWAWAWAWAWAYADVTCLLGEARAVQCDAAWCACFSANETSTTYGRSHDWG